MLYIPVNASTNGDNQLKAGVSGKRIKVTGGFLIASGTVTAKFTDGPGGTALTGPMDLVAQTVLPIPFAPTGVTDGQQGHFATSQGNDLTLNLNAGVKLAGWLTAVLEP